MALTGAATGRMTGVEFATGRGATLVYRAGHLPADLPRQGNTTRFRQIRAAHSHQMRCHRYDHLAVDAFSPGKSTAFKFDRMKINTKTGATGATALADTHDRFTWQRHKSCPEARYFFSKGVIGSSVCQDSATTFCSLSKRSAIAISSM